MNCGDWVFCLGGDCFASGYAPNQDFALAASHLGAIEAAVDDFDVDAMAIFKGENLKCKKTSFGFKNCCKDKGWGLDLGLSQCKESEKILGEKREAGFCTYIGTYKEGSFLDKRKMPPPMRLPVMFSQKWDHESDWTSWPLEVEPGA